MREEAGGKRPKEEDETGGDGGKAGGAWHPDFSLFPPQKDVEKRNDNYRIISRSLCFSNFGRDSVEERPDDNGDDEDQLRPQQHRVRGRHVLPQQRRVCGWMRPGRGMR